MVEILDRDNQRRDLLSQLLQQHRNNAFYKKNEQPGTFTPRGREIHDTVELSDGAKLVNLKRGLDLAHDILNDRNPDTLRDRVKQGSEDVSRIGKLFRAVFTGLRSVFGRFY